MAGPLIFLGSTHVNSPSDKGNNKSPLEIVLGPTTQSQVLKTVIIGPVKRKN